MVTRRVPYLILAIAAGVCAAQEPSVRLRLDRRTVQVNAPFLITLEITGDDVETPVIPDADGLRIGKTHRGTSTSTQVSIVNFRSSVTHITTLDFEAVATRTGQVEIPPIAVVVGGKTVQTEPAIVNVIGEQNPTPGRPRVPQQPAQPQRATPQDRPAELSWEDLAFITSTVDKNEVYQGEPVSLRLQVWRVQADGVAVGARNQGTIDYPDTQGFYASTYEPEVRQDRQKGWPYEVWEFQQSLYPTTTGQLTIGKWRWQGAARAFTKMGMQRHDYDLETEPIVINVRPLPPPPPEFSGSVGDFTFEASVSRTETLQGSPIALVMKVKGCGNPNATGEPVLPSMEGVYVSDPQKDTRQLGDNVSVEKTVTYQITPLEPRDIAIPAVSFCYFNPTDGQYKTIQRGPFPVHVVASGETARPALVGSGVAPGERAVNVVGEDIHPIVSAAGPLRPRRASVPLGVALSAIPVAAYAVLAWWMRRRKRFEQDVSFARNYRARSKAYARLKGIEGSAQASEELYRALAGFIADKLNLPEAGLTSSDAETLLREREAGDALIANVVKVLRACERARYAGVRLSDAEVEALTHAAAASMEELDGVFKRRRKPARGKGNTP